MTANVNIYIFIYIYNEFYNIFFSVSESFTKNAFAVIFRISEIEIKFILRVPDLIEPIPNLPRFN